MFVVVRVFILYKFDLKFRQQYLLTIIFRLIGIKTVDNQHHYAGRSIGRQSGFGGDRSDLSRSNSCFGSTRYLSYCLKLVVFMSCETSMFHFELFWIFLFSSFIWYLYYFKHFRDLWASLKTTGILISFLFSCCC